MNNLPQSVGHNCTNCTYRSQLFNFLSNEELEMFNQKRIAIHYNKGETIRKQGTFMSHVISLNSGMVKLYLEGIYGRNTILRIVTPTNFIGGPGIFLDQVHHFSIKALMDTNLCFIEMELFKQILESNRLFAREFTKDLNRNILSVYQRLIDLTQKQTPGRMADSLLYLFNDVFRSEKFEMCLSKQDLADLTGISLDNTLKILREFKSEGFINYDHHTMELLDTDALSRISRTG